MLGVFHTGIRAGARQAATRCNHLRALFLFLKPYLMLRFPQSSLPSEHVFSWAGALLKQRQKVGEL